MRVGKPAMDAVPVDLPVRIDDHGRVWKPKQAIFTPAALEMPYGQEILRRVEEFDIEIVRAKTNRITGLRGEDERATYRTAKRTLAVTVAPPSAFKFQPIPPSADYRADLAEGCPGHCQYCYLAGSLNGPPVIRVFANLPKLLDQVDTYAKQGSGTTSFECSCYTDPLGIEHLTGGLAMAIQRVANMGNAHLRWTTKYDNIDSLLNLEHNGRTRIRFSVNGDSIARQFEGGVANMTQRLTAARKAAIAGYPLGFTVAPIMPVENWQDEYGSLFDDIQVAVSDVAHDVTFELITHRFTPGSKEVLLGWYPKTALEMDESLRAVKTNKFGGRKFVYKTPTIQEMRAWFESEINTHFPDARILYWT